MTLWVQEALYARDELPSAFTRCTRLDSQGCAVLYAFMSTQHATVSAVDQTMMCKIKYIQYIGSPLNSVSVCSVRFNVLLSLVKCIRRQSMSSTTVSVIESRYMSRAGSRK